MKCKKEAPAGEGRELEDMQRELNAWKDLCHNLDETIGEQSDENHRLWHENRMLKLENDDLKSRKLMFAWVFSLLAFLLSGVSLLSAAILAR